MGKINPARLESYLKGKDTVLFVLSRKEYSDKVINIVRILSRKNPKLCYVAANKTAKALVRAFKAKKIDVDKFWFIDCISRASFSEGMAKKEQKSSLILFMDSPKDLAKLEISLAGAINNGMNPIFVDALSTFVIYNDGFEVLKFSHRLMSRIQEAECRGYFVALKSDISDALLDDLSMFVDGIVEL